MQTQNLYRDVWHLHCEHLGAAWRRTASQPLPCVHVAALMVSAMRLLLKNVHAWSWCKLVHAEPCETKPIHADAN